MDYVDYQYIDENVDERTVYYRLKQSNIDRSFSLTKIVKVEGKDSQPIVDQPVVASIQ